MSIYSQIRMLGLALRVCMEWIGRRPGRITGRLLMSLGLAAMPKHKIIEFPDRSLNSIYSPIPIAKREINIYYSRMPIIKREINLRLIIDLVSEHILTQTELRSVFER